MLLLLNRKHNNYSLSIRNRQRLRRKCFVVQGIDNPYRLAYNCKSPHKPCFAPFNGVEANISTKYSLQYLGPQTKISVFIRSTTILGGQGKTPLHYISKLKTTLKKYRFIWDIYTNDRSIFMTDRINDVIRKHFSWKYVLFTSFHRMSALRLSLCNLRDRNVTT
jgi:hypothetical protein